MNRLQQAIRDEHIDVDTNNLGNVIQLVQATRDPRNEYTAMCEGCLAALGQCDCISSEHEAKA